MNDTIKEYTFSDITTEELKKEINRMWNKFPAIETADACRRFDLLSVAERLADLRAMEIPNKSATE